MTLAAIKIEKDNQDNPHDFGTKYLQVQNSKK